MGMKLIESSMYHMQWKREFTAVALRQFLNNVVISYRDLFRQDEKWTHP